MGNRLCGTMALMDAGVAFEKQVSGYSYGINFCSDLENTCII